MVSGAKRSIRILEVDRTDLIEVQVVEFARFFGPMYGFAQLHL